MRSNGLPIAAYLGMLVALALAAAFIAVLAVVIWLPPRPPDVMRADVVAAFFESGYGQAAIYGRPQEGHGMSWSVQSNEPRESEPPASMRRTQIDLARRLALETDQVRVAAAHVARNDVFVFQVREGDIDTMTREAERAARQAQREAERAARHAEHVAENTERELELLQESMERLAETADEAAEERLRRAEEAARERAAEAEEKVRRAEEQVREAELRVEEAEAHAEEMRERIEIARDEVAIQVEGADGRSYEILTPTPPAPPVPPVAPISPAARADEVEAPAPVAPAARAERPRARPRAEARAPPAPARPPTPPTYAPAPAGVVLISGFEIGAQLPNGRWLVMRQGRNWAEIGWIGRAALIIGGTLMVLMLLAALFARRLTRPIRNFSDAVQAVGVDPQSAPVREEGPQELRGAARAVNTMQARLRSLIADRTKTLAAVAHDMRTPLMRLRLAAENAPVEQRERMAKEIGEVEALVASFIAFARDDPAEEARVRLDLSALLQSIADDHAVHSRNVTFEGEERVIITGQSLGLKRLFLNLVENGLKYGGAARISLAREDSAVIVDIGDDGPGVPPDRRESVFEPFVRLQDETRGAGLGLAAARSIARAHGGDIVILDADKGALLRVRLPA